MNGENTGLSQNTEVCVAFNVDVVLFSIFIHSANLRDKFNSHHHIYLVPKPNQTGTVSQH